MEVDKIKLFLLLAVCFFAPLSFSEGALGEPSSQGLGDQGKIPSVETLKACLDENAVSFLKTLPESVSYTRTGGLLELRDDFSKLFKRCGVDQKGVVLLAGQYEGKVQIQVLLNSGEVLLNGKYIASDKLGGKAEVLVWRDTTLVHRLLNSKEEIRLFMQENKALMGLPASGDNR